MGNTKSKKVYQKDSGKFFDRERRKEIKREDKKKKNANPGNKRIGLKEPALLPRGIASGAPPPGVPSPATSRSTHSYDEESIDRMRKQLHNDTDAFLLNNILFSVQFFENYEREIRQIKNNPNDRDHIINEAMVQYHKDVLFADQVQECVHEHVYYQRQRGQPESLAPPRLFVIYDNMEASEPGDTSDYSAVLDAPFYKLCIEDCKEPGYVKLKKLEVLESALAKENDIVKSEVMPSDDSLYTDSEKESNDSDDFPYGNGQDFMQKLEAKIQTNNMNSSNFKTEQFKVNPKIVDITGRRRSGPLKQVSIRTETTKRENTKKYVENVTINDSNEIKPKKSSLKNPRRPSGPIRNFKIKPYVDIHKAALENVIAEDTETSGYRSTSSSRQNESSENESDYGYTTITQSTTPKKIELSVPSISTVNSGVLPEECWSAVQVRALDNWSEDEDEELDDSASKSSIPRTLYETYFYLDSMRFMSSFVDNFIINLGSGLGLTPDAVNNALTQGASIYCDTHKNGSKMLIEVFPALKANWPNAANQWIIRERKIIQNPRTNLSYQWPTKVMVDKAIGLGCLLVPVGFRPKRGFNPEQMLQWRIIFPAVERYLESCLAHSHMRCYLFALVLHKTFMEMEISKMGIDASHIKNHLFWLCEDNYASWPEDRMGETLRLFLRSFYVRFGQARLPNYFIDSCNDFKSIPKPILLKLQRRLADILEAPVTHVLHALDKLKYTKKDFYPAFDCYRLYEILTCKNPLRILNPALPTNITNINDSSDSEDDHQTNFWERAKSYDKNYQWKRERHREIKQRRHAQINSKKQKTNTKQDKQIDPKVILPQKMEVERRLPVLQFFISHFIAMARSSENFEAVKQAIIYLDQAQRLCVLLSEEPGGDDIANDFLEVIRDKLADCQRKLVNQEGFKLPRRESQLKRSSHRPVRMTRLRLDNAVNQDSPTESHSIAAFTFVDVHVDNVNNDKIKLNEDMEEESRL